jgi:uncharacterized protein YbjT (DUF2867 family)
MPTSSVWNTAGPARVAEVAAASGNVRLSYLTHMLAAPDSRSASLRAKSSAEHAIAASGVPYTIFRPTYFMETLPRHICGQRATVLGRQRHSFHMLAAENFAAMVSRALSTDRATDQSVPSRTSVSGATQVRPCGCSVRRPQTSPTGAASGRRQPN